MIGAFIGFGFGRGPLNAGVRMPTDAVVASIDLAPTAYTGDVGDVVTFLATARNAGGLFIPGQVYTATSSNEAVATVAVSGRNLVVTSLAAGSTTVTAHIGVVDSSGRVVTIAYVLGSLVLTPSSLELTLGDSANLTAAALNTHGLAMTLPALTEHTTDASIADIGVISGATVPVDTFGAGEADISVSSSAIVSNLVAVTVPTPDIPPVPPAGTDDYIADDFIAADYAALDYIA